MSRMTAAREASLNGPRNQHSQPYHETTHNEVAMSVRRRDSRFEIVNAEGVLRVWRDVTGRRTAGGEYAVISTEAAVKGELLTLYFASGVREALSVRVADSYPTLVDGLVRHQLHLVPLTRDGAGPLATAHNGDVEAE